MKPRQVLPILLAVFLATAVHGQGPGLSQFEIAERADVPHLAADANGFVVVWQNDLAAEHSPLSARRFSSAGEALTGEVLIDAEFTGGSVDVASREDGRFVLVWSDLEAPGVNQHTDVFVQRFSSAAEPLAGELRVNVTTADKQLWPQVAVSGDGGEVVVWQSFGQDGDGTGIFARRFSPAGEPATVEIPVNLGPEGFQALPAVAVAADGSFVVAWEILAAPGVFARRFDPAGTPLTGDVQVHTSTGGNHNRPAVTALAGGDFVVVWWQIIGFPSGESGLYGRRFTAAGEPVGDELRLSPYSGSVAVDADGSSLAAWGIGSSFDASGGPFGQHFSAAGEPEGGLFRISPEVRAVFPDSGVIEAAGFGGGSYVVAFQWSATHGAHSPGEDTIWGRLLPREARAGTLSFAPMSFAGQQPEDRGWFAVENPQTVEMTVVRSGGALGEAGVDYFLDAGAAEDGEDVSGVAGHLTFREQDPPWQDVAIEVLGDDRPEDTEDAIFRLAEATGAQILAPGTGRLRIYDNDFNPPELAPVPLGGEFVVSSYPGGRNLRPRVAISTQGNAVVVWQSGGGVAGRLFGPDGRPRSEDILVRALPPGVFPPPNPVVAFGDAIPGETEAEFLVVWHEAEQADDRDTLWGRRFDAGGGPRGEPFQVATCAPDDSCHSIRPHSRLSRGADGRFIAVWQYSGPQGATVARTRIDPGGGLTTETVALRAIDPTVAADADGNFVVAWEDFDREALVAQRFDAASQPLSEPFDVVALDPELHFSSAADLAMADGGHFAVAWSESVTGVAGAEARARRVSAVDQPLGGAFRPPDFPFGYFNDPAIGADPAGNLFTVWEQSDSTFSEDGDSSGVFGRRTNWRWGPVGGELRINTTTEGFQSNPDVAVGRDGTAFVVWNSSQGGTSTIMGQRFAPSHCVPGPEVLCLQDGRFRLRAEWRDFEGNTGRARAAEPLTRDTGHFWFFGEDNVEIVVKVLDGRPVNDHYWVYYASLSNVEYTLTVTDTLTGIERQYVNPLYRFASAGDTEAFPGDDLGEDWPTGDVAVPTSDPPDISLSAGSCVPGDLRLCLGDGRFELEVAWRDFNGATGAGHAVPLTAETGTFWFFGEENVELVVKVLDGRALTGHFWVFYGALSNVGYTLTVTDTVTGHQRQYVNPAGRFASVGDTEALPGE